MQFNKSAQHDFGELFDSMARSIPGSSVVVWTSFVDPNDPSLFAGHCEGSRLVQYAFFSLQERLPCCNVSNLCSLPCHNHLHRSQSLTGMPAFTSEKCSSTFDFQPGSAASVRLVTSVRFLTCQMFAEIGVGDWTVGCHTMTTAPPSPSRARLETARASAHLRSTMLFCLPDTT